MARYDAASIPGTQLHILLKLLRRKLIVQKLTSYPSFALIFRGGIGLACRFVQIDYPNGDIAPVPDQHPNDELHLFEPSIPEGPGRALSIDPRDPPWRVPSLSFIALFAGLPAFTIFALVNCYRLRMPRHLIIRVAVYCCLCALVTIAAIVFLPYLEPFLPDSANLEKANLYIANTLAVATFFAVAEMQDPYADRHESMSSLHSARNEQVYAQLFWLGLGAYLASLLPWTSVLDALLRYGMALKAASPT